MKALVISRLGPVMGGREPLDMVDLPAPRPGSGQILIQVSTCGICHTELDEIEGRTPPPRLPVVPGHQLIGRVVERGPGAVRFQLNDRVGVGWINSACGQCYFCRSDRENLCADFRATGRDTNGGYAELTVVDEKFAYAIPKTFSDIEAAPLLCAGAIGYRSLHLTGLVDGQNLGLTGFGASAHLVLKLVRYLFPKTQVFVQARSPAERAFAVELGAVWAGDTEEAPPEKLDAVIDTTPAWRPIIKALESLSPGGRLVINAIRKENADQTAWLDLDYPRHIWLEKEIKSVANVTRRDIAEFLDLAARIPLKPEIQVYGPGQANQALIELKERKIKGAKVLIMS